MASYTWISGFVRQISISCWFLSSKFYHVSNLRSSYYYKNLWYFFFWFSYFTHSHSIDVVVRIKSRSTLQFKNKSRYVINKWRRYRPTYDDAVYAIDRCLSSIDSGKLCIFCIYFYFKCYLNVIPVWISWSYYCLSR